MERKENSASSPQDSSIVCLVLCAALSHVVSNDRVLISDFVFKVTELHYYN